MVSISIDSRCSEIKYKPDQFIDYFIEDISLICSDGKGQVLNQNVWIFGFRLCQIVLDKQRFPSATIPHKQSAAVRLVAPFQVVDLTLGLARVHHEVTDRLQILRDLLLFAQLGPRGPHGTTRVVQDIHKVVDGQEIRYHGTARKLQLLWSSEFGISESKT
jgi:hypothetical protein